MNTLSQSLAGRTALLKLLPLSLAELPRARGDHHIDQRLFQGFFPRIVSRNFHPTKILSDYFDTYVERDLRQIQEIKNFRAFEIFVRLCAGRVGQLLNMQSLSNEVGVSQPTIRSWLSLLEASFVIFLLPPYHANISKRLVKTPKLYFIDVGLASFLLGIEEKSHLFSHPLRGNLIENLTVIEAVKFRFNQGKRANLSFYRDNVGNEVDLIYANGPELIPIEIKSGETVNPVFFKGIEQFQKAHDKAFRSILFFGGTQPARFRDTEIWPILSLHEALRKQEKNPARAE